MTKSSNLQALQYDSHYIVSQTQQVFIKDITHHDTFVPTHITDEDLKYIIDNFSDTKHTVILYTLFSLFGVDLQTSLSSEIVFAFLKRVLSIHVQLQRLVEFDPSSTKALSQLMIQQSNGIYQSTILPAITKPYKKELRIIEPSSTTNTTTVNKKKTNYISNVKKKDKIKESEEKSQRSMEEQELLSGGYLRLNKAHAPSRFPLINVEKDKIKRPRKRKSSATTISSNNDNKSLLLLPTTNTIPMIEINTDSPIILPPPSPLHSSPSSPPTIDISHNTMKQISPIYNNEEEPKELNILKQKYPSTTTTSNQNNTEIPKYTKQQRTTIPVAPAVSSDDDSDDDTLPLETYNYTQPKISPQKIQNTYTIETNNDTVNTSIATQSQQYQNVLDLLQRSSCKVSDNLKRIIYDIVNDIRKPSREELLQVQCIEKSDNTFYMEIESYKPTIVCSDSTKYTSTSIDLSTLLPNDIVQVSQSKLYFVYMSTQDDWKIVRYSRKKSMTLEEAQQYCLEL